jgi:hypothetical protein
MSNGVVDPNSPVGQSSGSTQGLTEFAGPYVGEMLGKARALADTPYQAYGGPLTAGASGLQGQAFAGYAGLDPTQQTGIASFGGDMTAGGTFGFGSAAGQGYQTGYTPGSYDLSGMQQGTFQNTYTPEAFTASAAQQYMNPYLQAALNPQIAEVRRQEAITQAQEAGRAAQAGAFGGSRSFIMDAERARNTGQQIADITGQGYARAFDTAMGQFNTEQQRAMANRDAMMAQFNEQERMRQRIAEVGVDQFNREEEARRQAEEARRGQFNVEAGRLAEFDERRRIQANEEARREIERQEREREQFNEQERRRIAAEEADRRYGLSALRDMATAGATQRGIEQEGITADYLQYQQEQQYPYEQLQFMQSMLQGLPITATSRQFVEPGGFQELSGGIGGILALLAQLGLGTPSAGGGPPT